MDTQGTAEKLTKRDRERRVHLAALIDVLANVPLHLVDEVMGKLGWRRMTAGEKQAAGMGCRR